MGNAKCIGRVDGLAVALAVGNVRHAAARMTVSVVVVGLVVAMMPAREATVSTAVRLSADSTALILGGTSVPTPDDYYIDTVKRQYIAPTHPGQTIAYVAVMTPEEGGPITGLVRLVGFAIGSPSIWGAGGAGWPDEPWWKLSGLFDLTFDQSFQAGVADLEAAMAEHGNDHLVIYGYSQGAVIANLEKRKLAEQYPAGTEAPDIDFVLSGDMNVPNGGIFARFPGLYVPILDLSFNGPEPTDTQFDTAVITRQYDGLADFPLYPINVIADLNALLGVAYVHLNDFDVSLPPDPTTSAAYQGTHGDTSYYFFETQNLPLFDPLRSVGVPEQLIDVVEPFFRVLVEQGYDRNIPPWEPTPARLIPRLNPRTVAADLANAIGEGITNAAALFDLPTPLKIPAVIKVTDTTKTGLSLRQTTTDTLVVNTKQTTTQTGQTNSTQNAAEPTSQLTSTSTQTGAPAETSTPSGTESDQTAPTCPSRQRLTLPATRRPLVSAQPGQSGRRHFVPPTDVGSPVVKAAAQLRHIVGGGQSMGGQPSAGEAAAE